MLDELTRLGIDPTELRLAAKYELDRKQRALFYLQNPFLFQRDILTKLDWRTNFRQIHKDGLEFINTGKRKKLILWPRKHLKSTIFTQGEGLRRALVDPDIRILIASARWDNAKAFLRAIKGYLQLPEFTELYGNLLPGPNEKYHKNNDAQLTLLSRKNKGLREPTFDTSGVDATLTSQHYDLIILDDLVARANITSIDMIDKVITYYKDALDLLDPGKELWVLGTRWHMLDLYGWIISEHCDQRCRANDFNHVDNCRCHFDVTFKQIKEGDKYVFDSVFNDQEANELLAEKGHFEFAAQYLNDPTDPSVCWFREPDIKASEVEPEVIDAIRDKLIWYVAVDPAESLEKRSCFTAAVAVGVDPKTGMWYVDDARQTKVETPGFIDLCFAMWGKYKPSKFGIEANTRKSLSYVLKDKMVQMGTFFSIEELSPMKAMPGQQAKPERIKRLQPLFEHRRIKINKFLRDLLNSLYTVPNAVSMDLPDALSYVMDMVPAGMGAAPTHELPRRYVHWKNVGY